MSLAFVCLQQEWDEKFEQRTITQMELHRGDVCAVTHGANPNTASAAMFPVEQLSFRPARRARRPRPAGGPVGACRPSGTRPESGRELAAGRGPYPINNIHQLALRGDPRRVSHHGDWKAAQSLIRRRAKELGVDVTTLPGFGEEKADWSARSSCARRPPRTATCPSSSDYRAPPRRRTRR